MPDQLHSQYTVRSDSSLATKQRLHRSLAYTRKASDATVSLGGAEIVLGQKPVQQTVDVGVTVSGKRALNCSSLITGLVARACVYWLVK